MKRALTIDLAGVVLSLLAGCAADLTARPPVMQWDATHKTAKAEILNLGTKDAGPFLVYFNGQENPQSTNRRPQVGKNLPGLAVGASTWVEANFAPLAHPDNANLARIEAIKVIVDPKHMVRESNENNNEADAPVWGANKPDLVVIDIFQDGPHYLSVKYKNIGAAGTGTFLFKMSAGNQWYGGNSLYPFDVPPPGEERTAEGFTMGLIGLTSGVAADVTAEIDWENHVDEQNENNNTMTKHIQIE